MEHQSNKSMSKNVSKIIALVVYGIFAILAVKTLIIQIADLSSEFSGKFSILWMIFTIIEILALLIFIGSTITALKTGVTTTDFVKTGCFAIYMFSQIFPYIFQSILNSSIDIIRILYILRDVTILFIATYMIDMWIKKPAGYDENNPIFVILKNSDKPLSLLEICAALSIVLGAEIKENECQHLLNQLTESVTVVMDGDEEKYCLRDKNAPKSIAVIQEVKSLGKKISLVAVMLGIVVVSFILMIIGLSELDSNFTLAAVAMIVFMCINYILALLAGPGGTLTKALDMSMENTADKIHLDSLVGDVVVNLGAIAFVWYIKYLVGLVFMFVGWLMGAVMLAKLIRKRNFLK